MPKFNLSKFIGFGFHFIILTLIFTIALSFYFVFKPTSPTSAQVGTSGFLFNSFPSDTFSVNAQTGGAQWNNISGDVYLSGKMGIGTITPTAKLDVGGGGVLLNGTAGRNYFKDSELSTGTGLRVGAAWGMYGIYAENGAGVLGGATGTSLQNNSLFVSTSGNVGIGTTTPSAKIDVRTNTNKHIGFGDWYGNPGIFGFNDGFSAWNDIVLAPAGNVGIGTGAAGPSQKLDVAGPMKAQRYYDDDIGYFVDSNVESRMYGIGTNYIRDVSNGSWFPYPVNNTNYFRGPTQAFNSPWYDENNNAFYINPAETNAMWDLERQRGYGWTEYDVNDVSYYIDPNNGSNLSSLNINNSLTVGVRHWGIEGFNYQAIDTYGGATIRGNTVNVGSLTVGEWGVRGGVNFWVNGSAYRANNSANWDVSSDIRLKKYIQTLDGSLDKLLQLRGVSFEWDDPSKFDDQKGTQMGMIAQEVEKVFPQWVGTGADGYKFINVNGFEGLVVEAFRELDKQNKELEKQLEDEKLKNSSQDLQISKLNEKIEKLEQSILK